MSGPGLLGVNLSGQEAWPARSQVETSGRPVIPRAFAAVRIAATIEDATAAWSHLQTIAPASPYQQLSWMSVWVRTQGSAAGISAMVVVAEDEAGVPVAVVPLGIIRGGMIRRAVFLGGRETNYNMGLFDPRISWTAADAAQLLRLAARQMRLDILMLTHQPLDWEGIANPLAGIKGHQPSPSFSHKTMLRRDGEAVLREHQSSAARKKLRTKTAHLAAIGAVKHQVARSAAEIDAVVTAHLVQKAAKLASLGLPRPERQEMHRLFTAAATSGADGRAPLELHALLCGEAIVATFAGLAHRGRFSGLLISYAVEPPYARCSPGEILLASVLKAKCAEGFDSFDLGIGEARYKETYCPIADPLVDVFMPLTIAGRLIGTMESLRLRLKSRIKRSPRAWAVVRALRKARGRAAGAGTG